MPRVSNKAMETKKETKKETKTTKRNTKVLGKVPEIKIPEKQSIVDEIVWCSKRASQMSKSEFKDVGVLMSHHKKNTGHKTDYYTIAFAFRNKIEKVFGKGDVYLQFGSVKNRIYFKVADPKIGYKLNNKNSANAAYVQATCTKEMKAIYEWFCPGEYHLKYDDFQELYYIEKEKTVSGDDNE